MKDKIISFAKQNPVLSTLIFTITSTFTVFLFKFLTYLFYVGYAYYYDISTSLIELDETSTMNAILMTSLLVVAALIDYLVTEMFKSHKLITMVLLFVIILFISVIVLRFMSKNSVFISLIIGVLIGIIVTLILLLFIVISKILDKLLEKKIEKQKIIYMKKNNTTIIYRNAAKRKKEIIFGILVIIVSFLICLPYVGFTYARDKKTYKTFDGFVVVYENSKNYICSPYRKKESSIVIDTKSQIMKDKIESKYTIETFNNAIRKKDWGGI